MRPRRTAEGPQLKFMNDDPNSSGATLALLDVESGRSTGKPKRNGYLTVSEPSSSRSASSSPLFLNQNGFIYPPIGTAKRPVPLAKPPFMMRFVSKTGDCNVRHSNVHRKNLKYLADIFTTLVDCQWRWCAIIFAFGFFSTWIFYALLYYFFAWLHDDLKKTHLDESEWVPCINKIRDFTSAYLYSLETQHTIGYGYRFANTQCPHVIIILCLQCLTGVALQSILVGVLFAKLSRPKMRSETLMFSREACICQRDGKMNFMFRVGDMRRSHIVEAHIRVICMKERITEEGEEIPFYQYDVDVGFSDGTDRLFLVWPTIISHEIDQRSPFYDISAEALLNQRLEVIVILEGIVEATGLTTQARTSYLPSEIRWGYRFEKVVRPLRDGSVRIDHDFFNKLYEVDNTPRCSPRELYFQQQQDAEADEEVRQKSRQGSVSTISVCHPMIHLNLPTPPSQVRRRQSSPLIPPEMLNSSCLLPVRSIERPRRASAANLHLANNLADPLTYPPAGNLLPIKTPAAPSIH